MHEWIVTILMLVSVVASFEGGRVYEKARRKAALKSKTIRLIKPKHYDRRV